VVSAATAKKTLFDERLPSLQDTDFAIRAADSGVCVKFIEEPLVLFEDKVSDSRVSRNSNYEPLLLWLERLRKESLSDRAYWAGRGWQCARIASYSNRSFAVRLYLQALVRGVFPIKQAVIVGAQVIVPYRWYQKVANSVVAAFGRSR
jgi:hypothetical protein